MRKIVVTTCVVLGLCFSSGLTLANSWQGQHSSYGQLATGSACTQFYALRRGQSLDPVKVIVGQDNGRGLVQVEVLGLPKRLLVTANGRDVSRYQVQRQPIVCSGETIGWHLLFDLQHLPDSAVYFEVQAGRLRDGRSVNLH